MKLRKRFGVVLVLAMLVSVLAMTMTASAAKAKKTKISQKTATIAAGKSVKLSVKNAKGKKVKWSSEDEDIAKVGSNGKVTGLAGGEATIVAKVGGKSYKCTVTVEAVQFKNLTSEYHPQVNLNGPLYGDTGSSDLAAAMKNTGSNKIDASAYVVTYPAGLALKWSSSNTAVATVDKGVVTAVANGTCVITAEATDGSGAADTFVVEVSNLGDDSTNPVVVTMANKDRIFDKYFGKVKVTTFFVDKDGNILKKDTPYATVDLDNKNKESWKDEYGNDNLTYYEDEYYFYALDPKVNALTSSVRLQVNYNVTTNKANFDGKKLGILADSSVSPNPRVATSSVTFKRKEFPKAKSEIIVYKDSKNKPQNGYKQIVYSVDKVAGQTLFAGQYGEVALEEYDYVLAEYVYDGKKPGEYPWTLDTYSDETVTDVQATLYVG